MREILESSVSMNNCSNFLFFIFYFCLLENEYFLLNYVFHVLRVVNGIMDDFEKQGDYRQSFTWCGGFHLWIFGVNKVADTLILVIPVSGLVLIFGCL